MRKLVRRLSKDLSPAYRLLRILDSGGAAHVFVADDLMHGRRVAIKVLREELAASVVADRFLAEIKVAAQLDHPNIVPLFDWGAAAGLPFYVMPFVEGESLRRLMCRVGRTRIDIALSIVAEIAAGLDYAHDQRVIHRDIKPENVIIGSSRAMVLDFGIALALDAIAHPRRTVPGLIPGTPAYMSPEQAAGEPVIDGRSDVYSLACVVYEMLCGRPPFTGSPGTVILRHVTTEPPSLTCWSIGIPPGVSAVVARALAKFPEDRYPTPGTFVAALDAAYPASELGRAIAERSFARIDAVPTSESYRSSAKPAIALVKASFTGAPRTYDRETRPKTRGSALRLFLPGALVVRNRLRSLLRGSSGTTNTAASSCAEPCHRARANPPTKFPVTSSDR